MNKYNVYINEYASYKLVVEADSEQDAFQIADSKMDSGDFGEALDPYGGTAEIDRIELEEGEKK